MLFYAHVPGMTNVPPGASRLIRLLCRAVTAPPLALMVMACLTACETPAPTGVRQQAAPPAPRITMEPAPASPTRLGAAPGAERRSPGTLVRGTDRLVEARRPVAAEATGRSSGEGYSVDFADASIAEVAKTILGDILGETYVISEAVQGKVTLQSGRPMSRAQLLATLEQILAMNDAALLQQDGVFRIVPASGATRGARVASGHTEDGQAPGTGVVVAPLDYIAAAEMQKIAQPFVKAGATLQVDAARNVLLIGGDRTDRKTVLDLIRIFDVDWLQGMSFGIFPIRSALARSVAEDLQRIFGGQAEGGQGGLVRFVPIDRLNAVLVVSPRAAQVDRVRQWIDRLDAGKVDAPRIFVYSCQYTRAEELAAVLNQVFGSETRNAPRLAPGLNPVQLRSETGPAGGIPPGGPGAAGEPRSLGMGGVGPPQEEMAIAPPAEVKIIPDPIKNTLVILATPEMYELVESALVKMDVESLQVLIEATFVEVTLTDALELGTQWAFNNDGSNFFFPADTPAGVAGFFNWVLVAEGGDIRVALRALQDVTEVNVLSSPNLMVLDNYSARIQIGDQVPILTQQSQAVTGSDAPIVSTVEYRDTGTILNLRPRVNASGLVQIELQQEVSTVALTTTSSIDSPTINQRSVQLTIAVHDNESIVLGGLVEQQQTRSRSGLPWLAQLPLIGFLFGTQNDTDSRRELLVILTPTVARDQQQANDITDNLQKRMMRLRPTLEEFRIRAPDSAWVR